MKSIALLSLAFLVVSCFPDFDDPEVKKGFSETLNGMALHEADRVVCAIEMYRLRHGTYPDSLAQLPTIGVVPLQVNQFSYERIGSTYALNHKAAPQQQPFGIESKTPRFQEWYWSGLGCSASNMMHGGDSLSPTIARE